MIILQGTSGGGYGSIFLLVGMLLIFYFFMILPQQKKQKQQRKFLEALKKGDEIITSSGMYGKIYVLEREYIILEIDKGVKVKFSKSFISYENTKAIRKYSN